MQVMHLAALDLNLALVLHALLTERSVSRAAKRLGLSQSATSHALARLRDVLGDPLVVRTPQGVAPTARAEAMVEPLRTAIALLEGALLTPPEFEPLTARRRFHVAATDYAELLLLPSLVADLGRRAPHLEVWLRPVTSDVLASLRRGDVDLVVGVFPKDEIGPGLRSTTLLQDRLVCMVRSGHPLLRKRLTLARFAAARHALVAPRGAPGGPVDDALAARGQSRSVAVAVPHFLAAPHLVAQSDLVLTVAERMARLFARTLPLRILEPPLELPAVRLSMVWHDRHEADAAHRWLRERLVEAAGRHGH